MVQAVTKTVILPDSKTARKTLEAVYMCSDSDSEMCNLMQFKFFSKSFQ